jgi:hypothetical protein
MLQVRGRAGCTGMRHVVLVLVLSKQHGAGSVGGMCIECHAGCVHRGDP